MKIKSAKTIGVYYEDLSLGYSCVQGVRDLAESLQLEITYEKVRASNAHINKIPIINNILENTKYSKRQHISCL